MVEIDRGIATSIKVLELIKKDRILNRRCNIWVRCFHNGRENGLTFTLYGIYIGRNKSLMRIDKPMTYCVYEHRNSDDIIINGKQNWTSFSEDFPYKSDSKWDYYKSYRSGQVYRTYKWLRTKFLEIHDKEILKTVSDKL